MQAERYIAAVDLGSSKIALSVAKIEGDNIQLIYYRESPSDGVRYSCVFNPGKAAAALKKIVADAENELHIKILQVVVGMPRYRIRQEAGTASNMRSDPSSNITSDEVNTLKSMAIDSYELEHPDKELIYGAVAQSFSADDELVCASENDIVGATADTLKGNFNIFIGNQKHVSNIDKVLNDVGIASAHKIFVPTALANAVLTEAEKENGVALIEMGAGVTSLAIYKGNRIRHYSSIPFGGKSITADIKSECGFTEKLAENIKLAYGACMPDKLPSLSEKIIQVNDDENGSYEQLPVRYLSEIISCRVKEIIEAVLFLIQSSGYADKLRNGIVLSGGGANLVNLAALIKEMSGYSVRLGYPRSILFSSEGCSGSHETSAAASIGMILEAKRYSRLNCIEEDPSLHEGSAATGANLAEDGKEDSDRPGSEAPGDGTIFGEDVGEVITPKPDGPKPEPKPKPKGLIWTYVRRKLEKAEDVVGDLFEEMK